MKILIIEDEPAAAGRLDKLVNELDPSYEIVDILDSVEGVLNWWTDHDLPDLILMDIHLADGSSFEIFEHLHITQPVIFTTAYDQYAIDAFKVNALHYLLKPIKRNELAEAFAKLRQRQESEKVRYSELIKTLKQDPYEKRFLIRIGQSIKLIDVREAAYFYSQDKITFLISRTGKRYPIDPTLEKLEEMLDPSKFFRINRKFIVHIDSIESMYAYSKSRVKLDLHPSSEFETIVSTERSPHFKKWLIGEDQ